MGRNRNIRTNRTTKLTPDTDLPKKCPRCKSLVTWIEPILTDHRWYSTYEGFDIVCICGNRTKVFKNEKGEFVLG